MIASDFAPMLEVTRGPIVESLHFGALAIVNVDGEVLFSLGNAQAFCYLRSSAKPFQVLPFVEAGGPDAFGLSERELALMCASHSGTDEHVAVVSGIQRKIDVSESDLLCGAHPPYHEPTALEMARRGEQPTSNRHNCSGKHTGMLAQAMLNHFPKADYLNPSHPVQQLILKAIAEVSETPADQIPLGIDGCTAPVHALPLRNAGWAYARLADPSRLEARRAAALHRIAAAMMAHPDMVAGPERFDTLGMQRGAGRFVAKAGAEGYQGMGILPGALGANSPALGVVFKVADGDRGDRARPILAIEILRQLGLFDAADLEALPGLAPRPVRNWRGLEVGQYRPCFQIPPLF